jgi:putative transposase
MARQPRLDFANIPQHVVQRGNNRMRCFLDDDDRQYYLQFLRQGLSRYDCRLHAYVLMNNHVHLLLTPATAGAVSRLMHTFGRNYAGFFNWRHGRTGTLWEGRFKACVVDTSAYFLACSRYIELNPVRAWMTARPEDFPWSSHGANAGYRADPLLAPHPEYLALGVDQPARAAAYRALFADALNDELIAEIRGHLRQGRALGSDRFQAWVHAQTGRFARLRRAGRPPMAGNCL